MVILQIDLDEKNSTSLLHAFTSLQLQELLSLGTFPASASLDSLLVLALVENIVLLIVLSVHCIQNLFSTPIDELIPARVRGFVDLAVNGSYWIGAALGSVASLFFLNSSFLPVNVGWRVAFAIGAFLGS